MLFFHLSVTWISLENEFLDTCPTPAPDFDSVYFVLSSWAGPASQQPPPLAALKVI